MQFYSALAQPFFKWNDSIPVKINGNTIRNPWAGGLNFIQASAIDLNLDGIKDLFLFDRSGNKIRTFINKGTANTVDYKYEPQYENKFPLLKNWALLADYNCDSIEDIFSYSNIGGGFDVYKNISSTSNGLQFQLIATQVKSLYNPDPPQTIPFNLYVSSVDIPAISDIDNDGDLDVVTFTNAGTFMEYHKNMSVELYGTCDSLKFQIANRCWGYASESPLNNVFSLHDTCLGNISNPQIHETEQGSERHSGACELCLDLDGDGDKEIIVGGIAYNNLTMLTNGGSSTNANFIANDIAFPSNNANTVAVKMDLFPCAYYVDINNDGLKDLIVSPNAPNAAEDFNSVVCYTNVGTNSFPVFELLQKNLLQDEMIDVGEGAYPVFFDYDNDGLKDLFIGNYGYYSSTGFQNGIAYFKNTGTATQPSFDLITRDFNNLSSLNISNMVPTFGDMDGDGDVDMIIGGYNGKLSYFTNTASASTPANFALAQPYLKNSFGRDITVGNYATPQIFDVDNDGKKDIVIGGRNGKLSYYHHSGSATNTIPTLDSITNFLGNIKVNEYGYVTGYSYPFLFKQSGVTKLLIGKETGYLSLYDNIDGNVNGAFSLVDSMYLNINQGTHTAPFGTDINNDGFMDLIVGNYEGGVSFYKGVSTLVSVNEMDNFIDWNFDVFPNPANNSVSIHIINDKNNLYQLEIYNVVGQLISSEKIINNIATISTENFKQGIYICKINEIDSNGKAITGSLTKRIIIQH